MKADAQETRDMVGAASSEDLESADSVVGGVFKSVRRRRLARGVTLVEVLIVVAIMAVIAGGATLLVFPAFQKAKVDAAKLGADTVKQAAELYMNLEAEGDECPTIKSLVDSKKIESNKTDDPWGKPYRITCDGSDIRVLSDGNDRKEGTPDDVRDDMKPSDLKKIKDDL